MSNTGKTPTRPQTRRADSTVGLNPIKRDVIGTAMRVLTSITGSGLADKYRIRETVDRVAYEGTKTGFRTLGAANRVFDKIPGGGKPARLKSARGGGFDITPTEEQKMIVDTVKDFAGEILRPAAPEANDSAEAPSDLLARAAELGVTMINIPDALEGVAEERGAVTNTLVAEALAHGDMGLALPVLAPSGVAVALTQWGTDAQQKTYLPAFAGEKVPASAVVVSEPRALFDPFSLQTTATRSSGGGFTLNGVKSMVPAAGAAELFVVAAELEGTPAFFLVESDTRGLVVEADPGMGLRAAGLGRLILDDVSVPESALLGGADADPGVRAQEYSDAIALSRLGWSALAVGTGQAVLDYVTPYVNEREAFGEPVSHRQAVAFMVANIAIELDGLRLVTYRGASRADQGLAFNREAALARKLAADKGMQFGLDGVQLLGGHGYTKEHPVERWYRDLRAVGIAEGVVLV